MDDQRMLWESREWHLRLMPMHRSMCALRIISLAVSHSNPPFTAELTISLARGVSRPFRHVELDIDIGADAKDWSAVQATEKLKPVETELRRMEEMVAEIVAEMDYLRSREQKLRDTNESTNTRVKWFAFGTMGMLVALGAWQVVYLRAYFRYVDQLEWMRQFANVVIGRSISSRSSNKSASMGRRGMVETLRLVLLVGCRK